MHELSLMSALVEQINELSIKESFRRVSEIRLGVGRLSGIDPACIEFCFRDATRGSLLDGARLSLEIIPVELICKTCHETSMPEDESQLVCSWCGSNHISILRGREFKIIDLEVDSQESEHFAVLNQA